MNVLDVNNVTRLFGDLAAVREVSFGLKKGEIIGIAGPNGSGKTTLFNLVAGFYRLTRGEIQFFGKRIDGLKPHQICKRGIARILQIPQLFLTLSVYDNIRVGAHFGNIGISDEENWINEVIELIGLDSRRDVLAANLKLFDKKLTMLAAAMATGPKLLLLDEPIGGLSPAEINAFISLIRRIQVEFGVSILIIEHLMKVLTSVSNRMIILCNGNVISEGTPQEVTNNKEVIEVYIGEKKKYA